MKKKVNTAIHLMFAAAALALAAFPAHASSFSVSSSSSDSNTTFTVTRSGSTAPETVAFRTVSLSAYAGQHFAATNGTLAFAAGQTSTNVVVTVTPPSAAAYRFQTGANRSYRFEVIDEGGFPLDHRDRSFSTGTSVNSSNAFGAKDLTINAGTITVTDGGYAQAYHSADVGSYFGAAAPKDYLVAAGAQLRATVTFRAREKEDGYQYIAIYANTSTSYVDTGADDGDPGTVSYSRYMAGFTIDGNVSSTYCPYTFPLTSKGHACGAQTHPWSGNSNGNLQQQYFNTNCRASDGRLVIPANLSSLYIRLNASGHLDDTWYASNIVAHVQAVDTNAPYKIAARAAPGIHAKGNDLYVAVAFNEPVTVSGTTTLTTSWGTLTNTTGSGSNVLAFKGIISDSASGSLNITGWNGTIKDLANLALSGSSALNQNNLAPSLAASHAYSISCDLARGALPSGASNPTAYTYESAAITLANPTRTGYNFAGWTGSNGASPSTSVTIPDHSHGDRVYTANWTPITYTVHFTPGEGSGTMSDQTLTYDTPQALSSNAFTRAGYTFAGWDYAGATYADGASVRNLTNESATLTFTATWRPNIPYIDEDGIERLCTDYTVLTNTAGAVEYGGYDTGNWYVVTNDVAIGGDLYFIDDSVHLILCDGATLAVTNASNYAIAASKLAVYGQANGTGALLANLINAGSVTINGGSVTATGDDGIYAGSVTINGGSVTATGYTGIYADDSVTINGGSVTATATSEYGDGIYASRSAVTINGGNVTATGGEYGINAVSTVTLGWTNSTDSIYANCYHSKNGIVSVKTGQMLTDGTAIYQVEVNSVAIAGKTLRPAYRITLPEGVVASGVVTQNVTVAYALPGATVTLDAPPGYAIGDVVVNGEAVAPVDGIYSFAASAAAMTVSASSAPITYTVRFDANGGEGTMPDQSFTYDTPQALSSNAFTRTGCPFLGWVCAGVAYEDGATVSNLTNAQDAVVTLSAKWGIPYIDENGIEHLCTDYTVITNADTDVVYGGSYETWYVVDGDVTINGRLRFDNNDARLILCDGATLAVTNSTPNNEAVHANSSLAIYRQAGGTGAIAANGDYNGIYASSVVINGGTVAATGLYGIRAVAVTINGGTVNATGDNCGIRADNTITINGGTVNATGVVSGEGINATVSVVINGGTVIASATGDPSYGIYAHGSVAINGGSVSATGIRYGIYANDNITLGWTDPADSITASSYSDSVAVKAGQMLTDGTAIYEGAVDPADIAGKTLIPYFTPWKLLQARLDAGGTVTLLHDVAATDGDATLTVTNAVMLDLNGHTIDADGKFCAIQVLAGGDLTLTNSVEGAGTITGGNASDGGGVYVSGGAFTMAGGKISGNTATWGGGVYISWNAAFTMTDGEISGNAANYSGGGVFVDGTFTMTGGEISGNTASYGSGVIAFNGTIAVSGSPVVFANTNSVGMADNVYLASVRTIDVSGLSAGASIGVAIDPAPTLSSPVTFAFGATAGDDAYFTSDNSAFAIEVANGELRLVKPPTTPWERLQVQLAAGGTVTLTNDVTAAAGEASLTVSTNVKLDLNGHFLAHNGNGQVISVGYGGDLTLTNSVEGTGAVTGGGDHGIYVGGYAVFRLQGGAIAGNASNYAGGGVFVDRYGSFEMSGGSITNNAVRGGLESGGGVYVVDDGEFTMAGGVISGNAAANGGGVAALTYYFAISGRSVVSGNTNSVGAASNVYLDGSTRITVHSLSEGASIGVTTEYPPTVDWPVAFAAGTSSDDKAYFFSDNPAFVVDYDVDYYSIFLRLPRPWERLQAQLDAGGTVTLPDDVTAVDGDATLTVTNAVSLDLNGHTIDANGKFCAIQVLEGGDLTLTNSVEGAGAIVNGYDRNLGGDVYVTGGGVFVTNGVFTMNGGTICSNSVSQASGQGGGVYVTGGTFTMNGGAIFNNDANLNGGGVYVTGGTFTMTGGTVFENSVTGGKYQSVAPSGGGVYVTGGVFTMNGGTIYSNTVSQTIGQGGGVYVDGSAFTISGGSIANNDASSGGGVYATGGGAFTMTGGVISENAAAGNGGGVYVTGRSSAFTMSGGTISSNEAYARGSDANANRGGGGVYVVNNATFAMSGGMILTNAVQSNGKAYGGGVLVAEGVTTMSAPDMFTMTGGTISGNHVATTDLGNVWVDGGGVAVAKCKFTMSGGEVSGNRSSQNGGGVSVRNASIFTMTGGIISGNTAECLGSNIYGGGGVYVAESTFTMANSTVSGNVAADSGGGVSVRGNGSTFTMIDSTISGNAASDSGGGVSVIGTGTFSVSGSSAVFGNTNSFGAASNVYLPSGKKIMVSDLTAGASIGVTTAVTPTLANPVTFTTSVAAGDDAHFFSDDPGFAVCVDSNSRLFLSPVTYTVRFDANGGAGAMPDQTFAYAAPQALASNAFTRAGYAFAGWVYAGAAYEDGAMVNSLTNVQDAIVTLSAKWNISIPYIDENGMERQCTDFTVLTNAETDVYYDGEYDAGSWYVVTNDVTISGRLYFAGDAHLIVCDGAILAVTNDNVAIYSNYGIALYGQTNGTGIVTATCSNSEGGIYSTSDVTINGGNVTATGAYGIHVGGDVIIKGGNVAATGGGYGIWAECKIKLSWRSPTDSIYASSYRADTVTEFDQKFTDGTVIYQGDYYDNDQSDLNGKTLRPYNATPSYPAYLGLPDDPADDTTEESGIRAKYDAWALRYGYDASGVNEAAYLLNIAPWATPIELRIAGIEVGSGGATIRVTCRAGASAEAGAVDLSQINGVISVSAGDDLGALAPKAVSAANVTYSEGEATIFVPASAGRFVKAVIGLTAPEEGE